MDRDPRTWVSALRAGCDRLAAFVAGAQVLATLTDADRRAFPGC